MSKLATLANLPESTPKTIEDLLGRDQRDGRSACEDLYGFVLGNLRNKPAAAGIAWLKAQSSACKDQPYGKALQAGLTLASKVCIMGPTTAATAAYVAYSGSRGPAECPVDWTTL